MIGSHVAIIDYSGPFSAILRGDDVQGFDTRWDGEFLSSHHVPSDDVLESLYVMQIRCSDQLRTVMARKEQAIEQNDSQPSKPEIEDHGGEFCGLENQRPKFQGPSRKNLD